MVHRSAVPRWIDRVALACAWVAAGLFVAAGAMLSYEVAARYFFVRPTIWAAELAQLCLIWGALLAMAWVLKARKHIHITVLLVRLSERLQRTLELVALASVGILCLPLIWYGGDIALDSFRRGRTTGSMLDTPSWWAEVAVPVGFLLLAIQTLVEVGRLLRHEVPPGREDRVE